MLRPTPIHAYSLVPGTHIQIGAVLLIFAGLLMPATRALAFDPNDLAHLLTTLSCPACDLTGANLHGKDLKGADLRGANLSGAALDAANLDGARLRGADLSNASGAFVRLVGADISGANLAGFGACYDQDFTGAILRGADLSGAKLCASNWSRADLMGADLSGADLTYPLELQQAQLARACGDPLTKLPSGFAIAPCDADAAPAAVRVERRIRSSLLSDGTLLALAGSAKRRLDVETYDGFYFDLRTAAARASMLGRTT